MIGFLLWWAAYALDQAIVSQLRDSGDYASIRDLSSFTEDTRTIITTIASAMMTFIGVVFSISLVAVQMASGQFSPRVVRIFVRSRITKLTLAVFLATFLCSLLVLTSYEGQRDPRKINSIPVVEAVLTLVMVGLSLLLFVAYVNAMLRLMRVSHVIDRITKESFRGLAKLPARPEEAVTDSNDANDVAGPETERVAHRGRAGVLRDVNTVRLVRAARRQGVVLRLIPRVGDFVVPGMPVFAVHGGTAPPRHMLRYTLSVGVERSFDQDLGFGLRQLSDIALRAVSPAVNDPTTAVQSLDRIIALLAVLAEEPLGAVHHRDRNGVLRLVQDLPSWAGLVDLGLAEIRGRSLDNPQVSRRMMAGINDLLRIVPADRREPLERHRTLLGRAVERSVTEPADRAFALHPDRQGIG